MITQRSPHCRLLEARPAGGALLVRLIGPSLLQDTELRQVGDQLAALVAGGQKRFVLDLSALVNVSSGLLSKLLAFQERLRASGGRLALCAVPPAIWEVFAITRLASRFHVYPTEWETLVGF